MCCTLSSSSLLTCLPPSWVVVVSFTVSCPHGDDPHTDLQVSEVQYFTCSHSSGSFTLSFKGETTASIAYNAVLGSA